MPYFSFHYLMRHSKWVNNSRIINSQDIYTIYWGWGASGPFNPPYTFNNRFDFPLVFIDVFGFYSFAQSNLQILCFGPFIKDVINQGEGEFSKRWSYLISLFSKSRSFSCPPPPHPVALYVKTSHKIFLIIYDAQKTNYNLTTWSLNILEKSCTITFIRANKIVTHTP